MIIDFDGKKIRADQKTLHLLRPGVLKKKGAFETILVQQNKICAWQEHLKRFKKGLAVQKINFTIKEDLLKKSVGEILKVNRLSNARVRLSAWRSGKELHYAVIAAKLNQKKGPYRLLISKLRHPQSQLSIYKTLNYQVFYRASQEAINKGYPEALLTSKNGNIIEGTRTNIFILKDKWLYTPALKEKCLAGITRSFVMDGAKAQGLRVKERSLDLEDVLNSDLVFVTNSLIGLVKVNAINQKSLKITRQAIKTFLILKRTFYKSLPKIKA